MPQVPQLTPETPSRPGGVQGETETNYLPSRDVASQHTAKTEPSCKSPHVQFVMRAQNSLGGVGEYPSSSRTPPE